MSSLIEFANTTTIQNLVNYIKKCNDDYYNGCPTINDSIYDTIKDILDEREPNNELINEVGAPEKADRSKVIIPYYMGSMDKIKTTDGIIKFHKKHSGNYVLSDKEDGTSALFVKKGPSKILYKRGNKVYGRDISHILKYINLPEISMWNNIVIRGELIISRENYKKFEGEFSNARNMANGVVNSITLNPSHLRAIDFICFEIIDPPMKPSKQFKLLNEMGFITPNPIVVPSNTIIKNIHSIPESYLYEYLQERREKSAYDIDGIIITHDIEYMQVSDGNPKHSVGFKANSFGKVTTVKNVEWNISKHGVLVPRIEFNIIELSGSQVQHCTGYNAKYIIDNKLGPGSIIRVVLSGEIIPKITEFIETSEEQLPSISPETYTFDGVNFHTNNTGNTIRIKRLTHFFKTLGIENIGEGIIERLIINGYDSIKKILEMSVDDFNSLEGFQMTLSEKLYTNIHDKTDNTINCEILMCASLCFGFGFGVKKLKSIVHKFPHILHREEPSLADIITINGVEEKTAGKFLKGLDIFKKFMAEHPMLKAKRLIMKNKTSGGGILNNQKIVMTGFRDSGLEEQITKIGGTIQGAINKSSTILIVKDSSVKKGKMIKAQELGIKIMSLEDFKKTYNI